MMHELINDTGHITYCGPNAIGTLTGVPISRIEKMLRRTRSDKGRSRNGRRLPIKGTWPWQVIKVLKRLGCTVEEISAEKTLGRFREDTKYLKQPCLVEVTGHFCVTFNGNCSDSIPRDKRQVKQAWKVTAPAEPMYTTGAPQREKKPKPIIQVVRAERLNRQIVAWERKLKRAQTALKKLRPKQKRYEKLLDNVVQI